jgi:hypothetical protein
VFEYRMLRRIFRPKWAGVTKGWRGLYNEELRSFISWAVHIACMGEMRSAYKIFVRKHEGKRPLGGHRCRWEVNIKMDLREIGWESVNWMHMAQDRDQWWALVKLVMDR